MERAHNHLSSVAIAADMFKKEGGAGDPQSLSLSLALTKRFKGKKRKVLQCRGVKDLSGAVFFVLGI